MSTMNASASSGGSLTKSVSDSMNPGSARSGAGAVCYQSLDTSVLMLMSIEWVYHPYDYAKNWRKLHAGENGSGSVSRSGNREFSGNSLSTFPDSIPTGVQLTFS